MGVFEKGFKCFGQVVVFWMEFDRTWYEVCCLSPFVIGRVFLEYVGHRARVRLYVSTKKNSCRIIPNVILYDFDFWFFKVRMGYVLYVT